MEYLQYIEHAAAIVGAASMVATVTENKSDDKWVAMAANLVNFFAFNFGKAKNK